MKIAILSDIHANLQALNAVLEVIANHNISKLFVLGDIVGYYYQPKEVLAVLKQFEIICIKGNHEQMLEDAIKDAAQLPLITKKYGHGIAKAIKQLSLHEISFLTTLPLSQIEEIDSLKILLCHGSPWDNSFYLYPDAEQAKIDSYDAYAVDYIFYGHTHYPVIFNGTNKKIINPGSVGQSRVKGGVANFGILDTIDNSYTQQNVSYEINAVLEEVRKTDPAVPYLQTVLTRNNTNEK
jgi:putative phosphoesterase